MNSNGKVYLPLSAYTDPPRGFKAVVSKPDRLLRVKLQGKPGEALDRMHALGWRWITNFEPLQSELKGSKVSFTIEASIRFELYGVPKSKAEWEAALLEAWRTVLE